MAGEPVQFGENHANVVGAWRRLHVEQLFHRLTVAQAVRDRCYVIHAIHIRIEHGVGAMFGNLFHPTMEVADHALGAQNFFAVQLEDHTQHAVGRRVLGAHVDDEFVGIEKGFLVLLQFQVGSPVRHCPLSIPRLICTHS